MGMISFQTLPWSHRQTLRKWPRFGRAGFYPSVSSGDCVTLGTSASVSKSVKWDAQPYPPFFPRVLLYLRSTFLT